MRRRWGLLLSAMAAVGCGGRTPLPAPGPGRCGPVYVSPVVLAERPAFCSSCAALTRDDRFVYWAAADIVRVDKRSGAPTTIVYGIEGTSAVAVDRDYVYWTDWEPERAPKAGGKPQTLPDSQFTSIGPVGSVATHAASVYLIGSALPGGYAMAWSGIFSWSKPAGPISDIAEDAWCPTDLTLADGHLYFQTPWKDGYALERVPSRGGASQTLFHASMLGAYTVDGEELFVSASAGRSARDVSSVVRVSLVDAAADKLATAPTTVEALAADSQCVYVRDQNAIWRMPVEGGKLVRIAAAPDGGAMLLDGRYLYWTEPGQLLRLELDAGVP